MNTDDAEEEDWFFLLFHVFKLAKNFESKQTASGVWEALLEFLAAISWLIEVMLQVTKLNLSSPGHQTQTN